VIRSNLIDYEYFHHLSVSRSDEKNQMFIKYYGFEKIIKMFSFTGCFSPYIDIMEVITVGSVMENFLCGK
jgi:hypothetical protein